MICNKCGTQIIDNQPTCPNCGNQLYPNNNQQPKNNKLMIVIILGMIIVLLIAALVVILFKKDNNSQTNTTTTTQETTTLASTDFDPDKEEQEVKVIDFDNITIGAESSDDRSNSIEFVKGYNYTDYNSKGVYITYKHNFAKNIDVFFYINYFKDDVRIGSDQCSNYFVKSDTLAVCSTSLGFKEKYDKVTLTYKAKPSSSYYYDVEVTNNNYRNVDKAEDNTFGMFTNNTSKELYAYAACIRYKDDKPVFVHSGYINTVKVGETKPCTCYKTSVTDGIEYDKTECSLYSVYYTEGD